MRIGIDCRLPYYQMGGISRYVLHLLPALAALDQDNRYVVFHSRKDEKRYVPAAPNFQYSRLWTPCHHRIERWALVAELGRHKLDIYHSPDFIPPLGGAKRLVITIHDLNFLFYPQYLTKESLRYYGGQIAWAVSRADAIAVDSEHTRRDLLASFDAPPEKVVAIPLAAAEVFRRPISEQTVREVVNRYGLPSAFVLFVGTLEPRKNIPILLQAIKRLPPALDLPVVLVGRRGWLYDEVFTAIAALNLSDRVLHFDSVSDDDLAAFYRAASVLALPSHYEGFGFPPLEAMHCGCPVVVSNRASLPEIVGKAGILLEPDDPDAWAEALEVVLTEDARREAMIAAGVDQAAKFSWERTAAMTLELYGVGGE